MLQFSLSLVLTLGFLSIYFLVYVWVPHHLERIYAYCGRGCTLFGTVSKFCVHGLCLLSLVLLCFLKGKGEKKETMTGNLLRNRERLIFVVMTRRGALFQDISSVVSLFPSLAQHLQLLNSHFSATKRIFLDLL